MHYEINLNNSLPTYTAVVKSRIRPKDLAEFVPAACGQVWSFIRSAGLPRPGRNFALYLDTGAVEVGVQVSQAFVGSDRIQCSQLPAGRVASTTHYGPYSQLSDAHSAIREWCAEHDHRLSNFSWELYGHWRESWNADPSKICTDVFYLLHEEKG